MLSFDNAAILAVMSRRLPLGQGRRRALNYGLLIAYGLRILAILGAVFLVQQPLFLTLGGAYLCILFLRHFYKKAKHKPEHKARQAHLQKGMWGLSPLTLVVIQIGFVDLAFALDQVVAAVGFTRQYWLIVVAATIGLLALRVMAPFLSRLMDWLPILEDMAFIAVGLVGSLLVLAHPDPILDLAHALGWHGSMLAPGPFWQRVGFSNAHDGTGWELADPVKISLTLGLFVIPMAIKLLFKVPKSHHHSTGLEDELERSQPDRLPPKKP